VSVYILRWHGQDVTIARVEKAPRGVDHFATWEAAREHALEELRERAEDFEGRAKKLRAAITRLEKAQEEGGPGETRRRR
jgi:hypothetical protein